MSTSPEQLRELFQRATHAVTLKMLLPSPRPVRRLDNTRTVMAETLRWAASQPSNPAEMAAQLATWASEIEQATLCPCGAVYQSADEDRHFADVAHDWDDVPRRLRGLPEGGDHDAVHT